MQEYTLGFAFDEANDRVLMVKKTRGPEVNHGKWNGIGGKIDGEEEPIDAMHREWDEETGLPPQFWEEFGEMRGEGYCVYLFHVKLRGRTSVTGENDVGEKLRWFPVTAPACILAQNVSTIISHALFGTGSVYICN